MNKKKLLGVLSFAPIVILTLFFLSFSFLDENDFFLVFIPIVILVGINMYGLLFYYVKQLYTWKDLKTMPTYYDKRLLWFASFLTIGYFTFPLYWYFYIHKDKEMKWKLNRERDWVVFYTIWLSLIQIVYPRIKYDFGFDWFVTLPMAVILLFLYYFLGKVAVKLAKKKYPKNFERALWVIFWAIAISNIIVLEYVGGWIIENLIR